MDVKVQLLRIGRIWSARRDPFDDTLEGKSPQAGPGANDHPVIEVLVDSRPEHLAVELRQSARIRAVDHCFLKVADHTPSMSPGLRRARLSGAYLNAASDNTGAAVADVAGNGWLDRASSDRLAL